jgi:hypothetical protein
VLLLPRTLSRAVLTYSTKSIMYAMCGGASIAGGRPSASPRGAGIVIVSSAYGSAGDVLPMIGLAKAVQDRGTHQVYPDTLQYVCVTCLRCYQLVDIIQIHQ